MNIEELPKPILIEDLGMLYPKETSKYKYRFGLYECGFCGTHFKANTSNIKNGHTKSCGCYKVKVITKHGGEGTRLYCIWRGIKNRTSYKNFKVYQFYGGRGIKMCDEWFNDFVAFRDWSLKNGFIEDDKGLSIDRIDNDGNYEPNNCRWTTQTIQNRNKRIQKNNVSGYRGVSFNKETNKFVAYIGIDIKRIHLGYFKTAIEGAIAYNNYIIENNLEGFILNVIPKEKENYEQD